MVFVDISSVLLTVINSVEGLFLLTVACDASVDMSISANRKPTSFSLSSFLFFSFVCLFVCFFFFFLRLKKVSGGKKSLKNSSF